MLDAGPASIPMARAVVRARALRGAVGHGVPPDERPAGLAPRDRHHAHLAGGIAARGLVDRRALCLRIVLHPTHALHVAGWTDMSVPRGHCRPKAPCDRSPPPSSSQPSRSPSRHWRPSSVAVWTARRSRSARTPSTSRPSAPPAASRSRSGARPSIGTSGARCANEVILHHGFLSAMMDTPFRQGESRGSRTPGQLRREPARWQCRAMVTR